MRRTVTRQCLGASALATALVFVAACSGGPTTPSGAAPSSQAAASSDGATFAPFPSEDPCVPTTASEGFTTNPSEDPSCEGRFTGGGFQVGDVKVTRGFTLHCDELLSNNFEANWPEANNFHIDKNQPADCFLVSNPIPPAAPVSRIQIVGGTGTLNGASATVTLVLIDNGERVGAPPDQAYLEVNGIEISPASGSFEDPAPLDGGNIQAHFDQPHKN